MTNETNTSGRSLRNAYRALVSVAGACSVVMGVASVIDARDNMFFIPAIVFSLFVPIGIGIGMIRLGTAVVRGSKWALYVSWFVAVAALVPTGFLSVLLVSERVQERLDELARRVGW